jgi:hypothetical protein
MSVHTEIKYISKHNHPEMNADIHIDSVQFKHHLANI